MELIAQILHLFEREDVWFYCLVGMAVALKLLYLDEKRPTLKSATVATLAAYIVAKTFTDPTLEWIPTDTPEKYRDAIVVGYSITGAELLKAIVYMVRNPKVAVETLKTIITRRGNP